MIWFCFGWVVDDLVGWVVWRGWLGLCRFGLVVVCGVGSGLIWLGGLVCL